MDTLPHVSEEAAAVGKVKGEGGPEIEEQGTPVQEVSFNALLVCGISKELGFKTASTLLDS